MNCQQCGATLTGESPHCLACGAKLVKTSPNDPLIGRTLLNQYIIQKKLGEGGFGAVYEAIQPSIARKAAIKVLHPHLSHRPEIAVRFRREGLAASRLTHPAIVRVYNFGETEDEIIWIAMEHVEGETLSAHLRRTGALNTKQLIALFGPICEALAEAHEKGIVHRDLKPDNIMLTKDGKAKLLDFGVAALVDDLQVTSTGMMSGSPQYMPPEQWKGLKYTDLRSDIYALGVVAYQCLTNRLPFDADTSPAWMQKHCIEPPLEMTDIPKATQSVILKAMAKKPEERFQSTLELKKALELAEQGVTQILPASLVVATPTAPGTSKKMYAFIVVGFAAAFGVGLLLQSPPPALPQPAALPSAPVIAVLTQSKDPATAPTSREGAPSSTLTLTPKSLKPKENKTKEDKLTEKKPKEEPTKSAQQQDIDADNYIREYFSSLQLRCNQQRDIIVVLFWIDVNEQGEVTETTGFANPGQEAEFDCVTSLAKSKNFAGHAPSQPKRFAVKVILPAKPPF